MGGALIISILWAIISTIMFIPNMPAAKDLPEQDKLIVVLIFLIGGPFFAVANILEQLLDCMMPPGWGGDDDDFISKW